MSESSTQKCGFPAAPQGLWTGVGLVFFQIGSQGNCLQETLPGRWGGIPEHNVSALVAAGGRGGSLGKVPECWLIRSVPHSSWRPALCALRPIRHGAAFHLRGCQALPSPCLTGLISWSQTLFLLRYIEPHRSLWGSAATWNCCFLLQILTKD